MAKVCQESNIPTIQMYMFYYYRRKDNIVKNLNYYNNTKKIY